MEINRKLNWKHSCKSNKNILLHTVIINKLVQVVIIKI